MAASAKAKASKPRKRKQPEYRSFKLAKRIKVKKIPGSLKLMKQTARIFLDNKFLFGGIIIISSFLTFVFVQSFGTQTNFMDLKYSVESALGGSVNRFGTGLAVLNSLLGSAGPQSSDVASAYRTALTIIVSLAVIWAFRQILAEEKIRIRDTFYLGMYPLIPFILVLFVVGLQLIPLVLANVLYAAVFTNGLAITAPEQIIWACAIGLLSLLSLYMVLSSMFALYIATLPEMTPMKALRSARNLVLHRRLVIFARLLIMLLVVSLLAGAVLLPLIIFVPTIVEPVFYLIGSFALVFVLGYVYLLYRELL